MKNNHMSEMEIKEWPKIAKVLSEAMAMRGMSQVALARRVGLNGSTVSSYLSGKCRIPAERVIALCGALGLDPQPLIQRLPVHTHATHRNGTHRAVPQVKTDELSLGQRIDLILKAVNGLSKEDRTKIITIIEAVS